MATDYIPKTAVGLLADVYDILYVMDSQHHA
jgi:hypothetical protein